MANIRDVAELAQVSQATVSRVLNATGEVSDKTRAQVISACEHLNYRLNPSIQDLVLKGVNGATRNLAFVMVGSDIANPAYSRLVEELTLGAAERHYHLMLTKLKGTEQSIFDLPPGLRDERSDGLLVTGDISLPVMELLKSVGVPVVVIGDYSEIVLGGVGNVKPNQATELLNALRTLVDAGKNRIAYAAECPEAFFNQRYLQWFKEALAALGRPFRADLCYFARQRMEGVFSLLKPIFQRRDLPFDSIVCLDLRLAQEVASLALGHYGLEREIDVTIVATRPYEYYRLPVPTVFITADNGALAAQALQDLIGLIEARSARNVRPARRRAVARV